MSVAGARRSTRAGELAPTYDPQGRTSADGRGHQLLPPAGTHDRADRSRGLVPARRISGVCLLAFLALVICAAQAAWCYKPDERRRILTPAERRPPREKARRAGHAGWGI